MIGFSGIYDFFNKVPMPNAKALLGQGLLRNKIGHEVSVDKLSFYIAGDDSSFITKNKIVIAVSGNIYGTGSKNLANFILNKYKKNGVSGLNKLNGSYIILINDLVLNKFCIITDENSVVPFYYIVENRKFIFSWDISRLIKISNAPVTYNESNLMSWLMVGGRGFLNHTRFNGISKIEPGEIIVVEGLEVNNYKSNYFCFEPSSLPMNELVDDAAEALINSFKMRLNKNKKYYIGLSGGLDSRILLGAAKKADVSSKNLIAYTYGVPNFQEADIAQLLAAKKGMKHIKIELLPKDYIEFANDGLSVSAGSSIFKHGIHVHMYNKLSRLNNTKGLLLGSALDLLAGGTHSPNELYNIKNKSYLLDMYTNLTQKGDVKNYLTYNMSKEGFQSLCREKKTSKKALDDTRDLLAYSLEKIEGEDAVDINDALAFEIRIKRWYNPNLIYPQLSNNLILPTYDTNFINAIKKVPSYHRKDSIFRIKLLKALAPDLLDIAHDASMQPAWISPHFSKKFSNLQEKVDTIKHDMWNKEKKYLPSTRFDANFFEWFRVHKDWKYFLKKIILSKEDGLLNSFFKPKALEDIIAKHCEGDENNHKILQFLSSLQIMDNIFVKNTDIPSKVFKDIDFSRKIVND